jgi:hypothetical protein
LGTFLHGYIGILSKKINFAANNVRRENAYVNSHRKAGNAEASNLMHDVGAGGPNRDRGPIPGSGNNPTLL